MPAIRKIRIVNFRFNDHAKLIPDEIYCTENADGKPIDTLLNLENGGGKSVLVQLMLQPICPKAKVQNRNISDYFQRGTDHAFVLLEWALDGSSNSLLTGIALAASVNADEETESRTIRFYTFLHNYPRSGDKMDLINLPLTEKKGSHVRTLSYDELRKLLQNRKVTCFTSNQKREYQNRLEEYGISSKEWRTILERINAVEGGIEQFFEEYQTTDKLLNRFIIPGVMQDEGDAEQSLEEMFRCYAQSYAGQEENLRLQEHLTAFTAKLEGMQPFLRAAWDASDAKIQAVRQLCDLRFSLEERIREGGIQKEQLLASVQRLEERLHHIRTEQASEAYYLTKESLDAAEMQLQACRQRSADTKAARDHYASMRHVLDAAREYAAVMERRAQAAALLARLQELDAEDPDAHVAALRYSLYLAAKALETRDNAVCQQERAALQTYNEKYTAMVCDLTKLQETLAEETKHSHHLTGRQEALQEQIEASLKQLGVRISVMLDGSYSVEDIQKIRSQFSDRRTQAEALLAQYDAEEQALEQEFDVQLAAQTDLQQQFAALSPQMETIRTELARYQAAYDDAVKVLAHLNLPEERLFTEEPFACIERELAQLREQLTQAERQKQQYEEQLANMQQGQLHISKRAVSFLQETGISIQTGEYYLLQQPLEVRQRILTSNPLAAYAVIVDTEKAQRLLLSQTTDTWLSSIVPVYTLQEIADMADSIWTQYGAFLSAYDRAYFTDAEAFHARIEHAISEVNASIRHLRQRLAVWIEERDILQAFQYPADTEARLLAQLEDLQKQQKTLEAALAARKQRQEEIRNRQRELKRLQTQQQDTIHQIAAQSGKFEEVSKTIQKDESLRAELAAREETCKRLKGAVAQVQKEKTEIEEQIAHCKEQLSQLEALLAEYRVLLQELEGCPAAELLKGEYKTLLAEYHLYQQQRSANRQELQRQYEAVQLAIRNAEKDLSRFELKPEAYTSVMYSEEAYRRTVEQHRQAERAHEAASEEIAATAKLVASAEGKWERAKQQLEELHAEPLERAMVGSDFAVRIAECKRTLQQTETALRDCEQQLQECGRNQTEATRFLQRYQAEAADYIPKHLDTLPEVDLLREEIERCVAALKEAEGRAETYRQKDLEPFRTVQPVFVRTLDGIQTAIHSQQTQEDTYFRLYERTEADLHRYRERIGQLTVELRDVEHSRQELVTHCLQRIGRLYENLKILSKKSTVQLTNAKKQMLRIDLPEIDETSELLSARINAYITEQVKHFLSEPETSTYQRHVHLEIRSLLNCYIGTERIPVTVYKIDRNPQNSCYRTWEAALKANSGGEQFVIFFSLVVAMMNYTRTRSANLSQSSGVLILDNPFGPISSPHLLEPMFRIARHFHIQLICLTHLGTAAVTNCFEMVYQLRFRTLPLSSTEVLESEAKQHMEHAFYLSEQLALF